MEDAQMLDLIIVLVLVLGLIRGFTTGVVRQLGGLIGVVISFLLGVQLMYPLSPIVADLAGTSEGAGIVLAFTVVFFGALLGITIAIRLVEAILGALKLSALNRVAGGAVGLGKVVLLLSITLIALSHLDFPGVETRESSILYTPVATAAPATWEVVEPHLSEAEDFLEPLTRQLEQVADRSASDNGAPLERTTD